MPLLQYIEFGIDTAIEMLMDNSVNKVDVMLYLENFKKILKEPKKEIVDGDFREIEIKGIEERGLKNEYDQ